MSQFGGIEEIRKGSQITKIARVVLVLATVVEWSACLADAVIWNGLKPILRLMARLDF